MTKTLTNKVLSRSQKLCLLSSETNLPPLSPIAGDVQARLVRQPNHIAAVGVHFINVGVSGAAAEDNTL
jgi:hypothetical protein